MLGRIGDQFAGSIKDTAEFNAKHSLLVQHLIGILISQFKNNRVRTTAVVLFLEILKIIFLPVSEVTSSTRTSGSVCDAPHLSAYLAIQPPDWFTLLIRSTSQPEGWF